MNLMASDKMPGIPFIVGNNVWIHNVWITAPRSC